MIEDVLFWDSVLVPNQPSRQAPGYFWSMLRMPSIKALGVGISRTRHHLTRKVSYNRLNYPPANSTNWALVEWHDEFFGCILAPPHSQQALFSDAKTATNHRFYDCILTLGRTKIKQFSWKLYLSILLVVSTHLKIYSKSVSFPHKSKGGWPSKVFETTTYCW